MVVSRHSRAGFSWVDLCFDSQSPLAKKGTERWRDRALDRKFSAEESSLVVGHGKLLSRDMMKISSCRDAGRHSFLKLLDELVREPDWLSGLRLPPSTTVTIRGASRSELGATVDLSTDASGRTTHVVRPASEWAWHEEADTLCVWAAYEHGLSGRVCLVASEDNDVLLACVAGLPAAIDAAAEGSARDAARAAAERVYLQASKQWLKSEDGARVRGKPTEAQRRQLRKSQVLAVGHIAVQLCYGSNVLAFLPQGAGRALTFAYAATLFGGDTVEKIAGFTPSSAISALLFLANRLELPPGGHAELWPSEETLAATARLIIAAVYQKHRSWFSVQGAGDAPAWVASQSLDDVALTVFEHTRAARQQLLTADQIATQAAKRGPGHRVGAVGDASAGADHVPRRWRRPMADGQGADEGDGRLRQRRAIAPDADRRRERREPAASRARPREPGAEGRPRRPPAERGRRGERPVEQQHPHAQRRPAHCAATPAEGAQGGDQGAGSARCGGPDADGSRRGPAHFGRAGPGAPPSARGAGRSLRRAGCGHGRNR